MSQWQDDYTNHPVHAELAKLVELNGEFEDKEIDANSRQSIERIAQATTAIRNRVQLSDPLLTPTPALDQINTQIAGIHAQLTAYMQNANVTHLAKATTLLNAALAHVPQLAFPLPGLDENSFDAAAERFTGIVGNLSSEMQSRFSEYESQNQEASAFAESARGKLVELEGQIRTEKERLDKVVSDFQKTAQEREDARTDKFSSTLAQFNDQFAASKVSLSEAADILQLELKEQILAEEADYKGQADSILVQLGDLRDKASNLVHVIGNIGVTGNYQLIASKHEKTANGLRNAAVALFLAMACLVIYTALRIDEIVWQAVLFRLTGALILAVPAAYLARESSKHRELAIRNRRIELEMASLEPFIETLDDTAKKDIKKDLIEKYFGQKEQLELREDSIPAGPFMDVVKVLIKAFGDK